MYERFTDRARKVMQIANQEAQRFNHEYIGTEHMLLALIKEGSGTAARVLDLMGIDLRAVRLEVEKLVPTAPGGDQVVLGKLPHTPSAKRVIELSVDEARGLLHNYVGTEHILLGLLREHEGVAAAVLENLKIQIGAVRANVIAMLSGKGIEMVAPATAEPAKPGDRVIVKGYPERILVLGGIAESSSTAEVWFVDHSGCPVSMTVPMAILTKLGK